MVTFSVLAWAGVQLFHQMRRLLVHAFAPYPLFPSFGAWAVITGCTDGIGLSYAKELARRGMKIVLISRNPEKLEAVAWQIKKEFSVETLVVQADFRKLDIYEGIKEKLAGLDVGVLVNNVGITTDIQSFLDVPEGDKAYQDLILVNNMSLVRMTHMVLPGMVEKGKGIIINVSSLSAVSPIPLIATYAATKAFVDSFSRSLAWEYKSKGIHVHLVGPGFVYTKKTDQLLDRPSLGAPTPDTFVRSDLRSITKIQVTSGYWLHNLQRDAACFVNYVSPAFATSLGWWGMKFVLEKSKQRSEKRKKQ
ncbi:unnamed protein product [Darwinula stevensoni]|uniref:Uncharacterized protein n=1 Tax=Darwinula stevensoni TaxID=69355 RepID=A0A7R8X3Z7_9CRUS|nr:unnamed protein product [Darwinula stevensoni]CAG0879140.1 unnamed protein product [Darwinula stevensoni]